MFGSAIPFSLYYWLLQDIASYQLGTIDLIVPLVAAAESAMLLGENVPMLMVVAMIVVLCSVFVVIRGESPKEVLALSEDIEA